MTMNTYTNGIGRAYAQFDCEKPFDDVNAVVHRARDAVDTSSAFGIFLSEPGTDINDGFRYRMDLMCHGVTNGRVAEEAPVVMNQVYQSSLYRDHEAFSGQIAFEENGRKTVM